MTTPYDLLIPTLLDRLGVSTEDLETDLAVIDALIDAIQGSGFDTATDSLSEIGHILTHNTLIWPWPTGTALIDLTCTLQGGLSNVWGAWTRLVDSGGGFFDTLLTSHAHLTALAIEFESVGNSIWAMEIASRSPAATYTVVGRIRWVNTVVGIFASVQKYRIRSAIIPVGYQMWGRLMCNNVAANQTCRFHLRYFMR